MKKRINRLSFNIPALFAVMVFMTGCKTDSKKPIYMDTAYSFEERAADLVSRMTLEEKQGLLGNTMAAIPRLGINAYNMWGEALHGIASFLHPNAGPATSFPNSVALGAAWDPVLMQREASVISEEARGFNYTIMAGLTYWSPVVEPVRDPRWGRTGESYGEDPFLISRIAGGFVRGMMGDDPAYLKAVPCGKHYFANNSEFNRHFGSSDMDDRDMREFYLAPYKKLIEKDNLPGIMSCYNAVNGVPVTASKYFIDSLARKTYGLNGYVTGDCGAVGDILTGHNYAKSKTEATAMALKAGVDTDCGDFYQTSTIDVLKEGLITEADMDLALVNIFTIRMRTGEFDPPSKVPYSSISPDFINAPEHHALAIEVAEKTPVLLKNNPVNNKRILPLNVNELNKITIIGPQADKVELGPYTGMTLEANRITPLSGIKTLLESKGSSAEIVYSEGGNTLSMSNMFNIFWFEVVKNDGSVVRYHATDFDASAKGITAGSEITPEKSLRSIKDGDWTSYNNLNISNIENININLSVPGDGGSIDVRIGSHTGDILASFDVKGGQGIASAFMSRTLIANVNQLNVTGNQTIFLVYHAPEIAPIDQETLSMASSSDVAIVFVGTNDRTASEGADRLTLLLPGNQYELIKAVAGVNPNTIVVIQSLGMVEVEQFKDLPNVAGIIWTGFNGQAQGTAIAKILFGDVNPGGKLNATWYKSVNDLPEITDYTLRGKENKNGRTYWYFDKDVSYEFGYGLSFTTFEYSNFKISKSTITPNDKITVSVNVKNTGNVDGDEVVQVYLKTPESPATLERPMKRLKGFQRVTIPTGQTETVEIDIDCADLWFWDADKDKITFDQGKYVFEIGASSKDIKGTVEATMNGTYNPFPKTVVAECGKVVLKLGEKVQTSITVAMSDDSFFDITKTEVNYSSNNPSVASVDNNGLVTAVKTGVVSITATVKIEGKTISDSYPLKIIPDLTLSTLTVVEKEIASFKPDVHGYGILLPDNTEEVPQVMAVATRDDIAVDVVQAKSLPGTAVITLTDNITGEKDIYKVNFGFKSVSDEFDDTTPGKQWSWVRENNTNWSLSESLGYLVITPQEGDIRDTSNNAENILLQSANTDWIIESKIEFSNRPAKAGQQGGLVAYQDDDNYVKLVYNYTRKGFMSSDEFLELLVENNGSQFSAANLRTTGLFKDNYTIVFKLEKKGSNYTAYYSINGKSFELLGSTNAVLSDIKAGLIACDGIDPFGNRMDQMMGQMEKSDEPQFEIMCDYFRIENTDVQ